MKTLISPTQVLRLAFGETEYLPPQSIRTADIAAAEERYVVPVIGRALHQSLLGGQYPDFTEEYLSAPTALFTRVVVQPQLEIRTGRCGATAPRPPEGQPPDTAARRALMRSLRAQARTLLRRAAGHLAAHPAQFPDYEPENNTLNRCSTDGNLVQIL